MPNLPSKVAARLAAGLRRFQPILANAKSRDVNESDTVVLVTDLLCEMFGYDKYREITCEYTIRSTFCDLAIKLEDHLQLLIEVKAIGLDLKEQHARQAVDYAANQGVEWVLLTNGIVWRAYCVSFRKPINSELVTEFNLLELSPRTAAHLETLFLLTREGISRSALEGYHEQRQALSRHVLAALILSNPLLHVMRRELRRLSPDVRIETEDIRTALEQELLKREVLDGDALQAARTKLRRAAERPLRKAKSEGTAGSRTEGARSESAAAL